MKKIAALLIILTLTLPYGVFAAGEGASFTLSTLSLYVGEACGLSVTTSAETLVWNSSNGEIAALFGDYFKSKTVYAKKSGTAEISVSDSDGNVLDTITVTVSEKVPAEETAADFSNGRDIPINKNVFGEHLSISVEYGDSNRLVEESIKFGSARVAFNPGNEVTDYEEYAKSFLTPIMRNNMTIVVILSRFVTDDVPKLMEQTKAICSVLKGYQECIYIEFGNEVYSFISDSFTISDYTEKCKSLYSLVKEYGNSIDKQIYTAVPVLDLIGKDGNWNNALISSDQSYFDAVAPHLYTNISTYDGYTQNIKMKRLFSSNENIYEGLKYIKESFPDKGIWITEYGTLDSAMLNGADSAERARLQSSKTLGVALCNIDKTLCFLSNPDVNFANYHTPVDSQLFGIVQGTDILPNFYVFEKVSDILSECTQIASLTSDNVQKFNFTGENYTEADTVNSVSGYGFSDIYGLKYLVFINRAENPCTVSFEDRLFKNIWEYSTDYVFGEDYLRKTGTFLDLPSEIPQPSLPEESDPNKTVTLSGYSMTVCAVSREISDNMTVSSAFNGLTGVPVCADIPLEFSQSVTLTAADITVLPKTSFTLEGEGTSYTVNFTGNMKAGNSYTIKAGDYGTVTYTTAYGTDLAKIPVNTPAGEGRTAQFGKDISEFTMKIDFMSYTELPSDKWINLYDDAEENMGILVSNKGGYITLGLMRYDAPSKSWKGPAVEQSKLAADFSDTAYVTVKDNTARIFVVSKNGTVTYGPEWNFGGSSIANCMFDSVSVNSILFGVEVGNASENPDADEYIEADCTATSTLNGLVGVPIDAKIPVTLSKDFALADTNVKITTNGKIVNGKIVEGSGKEYTVKFNMDYATEYSIQIGTGNPITFTTAYNTDLAKISTNTPAGAGRTASFGKDVSEVTLKISFMTYSQLPSDKFITLYDNGTANLGILVSNNGNYITLGLMRYDAPSASWKGPAVPLSQLKKDFSDVAYVTVKNNKARIFVVSKNGTVTYGPEWNFGGSSIANCVFDSVSVDSIIFGVEAGNGGAGPASVPEITITSADNTGAVSASYTLNTSGAVLICAVYDVSTSIPMLLDTKMQKIDSANGTTTFALNTNSQTSLKYKLFAFSDMESIVPIVPAYEYPIN